MSQDDEPEGLNQELDLDGNIVEEVQAEPNELPIYKSREDGIKALKKTETTNADDNHKYVKIELPASGVIGEKFQIKVSKKVPHLEFAISDKINFQVIDKVFGKHNPPQLYGTPFIVEKLKDVDKFEGKWHNPAFAAGKEFNALQEGDYLIEARAYGKEAWHDTTVRRIIKLTKK